MLPLLSPTPKRFSMVQPSSTDLVDSRSYEGFADLSQSENVGEGFVVVLVGRDKACSQRWNSHEWKTQR